MPSFDEKLRYGAEGELWVSHWIMRRGGLVLPAYDYSGEGDDKAPKLSGSTDSASLIVPDLLVAKGGKSFWVEVKRKRSASRGDTGISLRLWRHYIRTQRATGIPVWLVFVHDSEGEVRGGTIDSLQAIPPREYRGTRMGRGGMVFFRWARLQLLTTVEECRAEYLRKQAAA